MVKKSTLKAVTFMKDKLLQTGLNVQKIIVFGSQANGKYNENSDIDNQYNKVFVSYLFSFFCYNYLNLSKLTNVRQ